MKKTFIKESFLTIIALVFSLGISFGQTSITTGAVSPTSYCVGTEISVPFTFSGTFNSGNIFTAQLSDANGDFTNPAVVASSASPIKLNTAGVAPGKNYKIRVVASAPSTVGTEISAIEVNGIPSAPGIHPLSYCVGEKPALIPAIPGQNLKWYSGGDPNMETSPITSVNTDYPRSAASPFAYITQTVDGCESDKFQIILGVYNKAAAPIITEPASVCQNTTVPSQYLIDAVKPVTMDPTYRNDPAGLIWYSDANGSGRSTSAPVPDTKAAGSKDYFVSVISVYGCESTVQKLSLAIKAQPAPPTVSNPSPYLIGAIAETLKATGSNLKWYTGPSDLSGTTVAPKPLTDKAGSTSYYVTQTVNDCESDRAEIIVTVNSCTTAAPTVADKSYFVGDVATALTATGNPGAIFKWYDTQNSTTPLASAPTPSTATAGTKSYFVTQTSGGCEGPKAELVVTVNCNPPSAPTVTNKSYTVGDVATTLSAAGVTGAVFKWYSTQESTTPLPSAPTPSTSSASTTSYFVSQTVGGCESARAEIVVTVNACTPPAAPTFGALPAYCIGVAASPLTASGTNLKWYNQASTGVGSSTAPTPPTNTATTLTYYVSQTVGGCESARAKIEVVVNQTDPPGVSDLEYCLNATATTLTATASGSLKWYANASGGSALSSAPVPATNAVGTKSYYVTQTVNGCESPRAEIKVVVKNLSTAPTVTATINLCQNSTATALTATGTALKWYTGSTGGTALGSAPVPVTTTTGTTSYYVSQTASGLCEGPRAKIDVVIKDTPAAPAVTTPVNYCVGEKPVALTPSGGVYKWYNVASGGTALATTPTPTATTAGTTSYYVTQSNTYGSLSCESPRAKLDVVVNATPAAVSALSEAFCQERTDKSYTFPTQAESGNTLKWYTTASGGTATTATPSINLKNSGETVYYVTQLTNKNCESTTRVQQKVRVKPLPAVPGIAQALIEYCQFIKAEPLAATPVANASLNWFGTDATGGTSSAAAPTPSTAEGGTTSYYVAQTLEGCIGDRAKIDVKINTTPKPSTKTYLEYCQNEVAPVLDATGTVLKWYREANGTEWQGVPFTPFTEKVQDYSFYVTQTGTNGCESPKEEIKIHIKSLPSATISGNSTIDLGQSASINIKFTGDGPWIYVLSNGVTDTTDQANHQVVVKPSTTTSYLVTEVSNACGKGLPIGSAVVTVKIPTINSGSPSVAEACAGKSFTVPFQQSGDFPAGNTFKVQVSTVNSDTKFVTIPSVASGNSVVATFPDTTKGGTYYIRVISSGTNPDFTVKGSVSSITINASPLPVATLTGTQTILVGESAELKAEITGKSPWKFSLNNGVKDTVITANSSPYIFKLSPKTTTTYAITNVTNTCGTGNGVGTARVQVDPILGVEPPAPADWAKVYPTVIQDKCLVEVTGTISLKQATVEVIDLNGRSRKVQSIKQQKTEVDFGTYPSGLYLLRIQNGNLSTVQRVMKP